MTTSGGEDCLVAGVCIDITIDLISYSCIYPNTSTETLFTSRPQKCIFVWHQNYSIAEFCSRMISCVKLVQYVVIVIQGIDKYMPGNIERNILHWILYTILTIFYYEKCRSEWQCRHKIVIVWNKLSVFSWLMPMKNSRKNICTWRVITQD